MDEINEEEVDSSAVVPGDESVGAQPPNKGKSAAVNKKMALITLVLFFAAGNIGYRVLVGAGLEQSSALFIGLPTLLAIVMILSPPAKTATGGILRGMTIALLMSGPLLGEGFICILMASPLFLGVGLIVGLVEDYRRRKAANRNTLRVIAWVPLLIMSFEGVNELLSFDRNETVSEMRVVDASVEECEAQLAQRPQFRGTPPFYIKLGFPKPKSTSGEGLDVGSLRSINFAGGEGKPGTLTMKVTERRPGFVKFAAERDTSHIAHWLDWQDAAVTMEPMGGNQTRVKWTTQYVRRLDPAWYFGPWERYGVKLMSGYLIDNLVSPERS